MKDYMVRATAAGGQVRAFAALTTETVEYARRAHGTSPVVTAGLGRLLTAGAMMGSMMKGEKDLLTLKAEGSGPVGHILVTADALGHVKGYAANPQVELPPKAKGKLDVGASLGVGLLTVIKDLGLKEPYSGSCELVSGEIGEDLTYYFATSEQTPSSVGLGVLISTENTVAVAGGFILQLMPNATEETISAIEAELAKVTSVTGLLASGMTPEDIIRQLLGGLEPEILDTIPVEFACNCSKERFAKGLAAVSRKDLQSMVDEGEPIEVKCHFCNTGYTYSIEELKNVMKSQNV